MAQAPMDNTMADFWHMIHQYNVGSIVMLNKLQENDEVMQYNHSTIWTTYDRLTQGTQAKGIFFTAFSII